MNFAKNRWLEPIPGDLILEFTARNNNFELRKVGTTYRIYILFGCYGYEQYTEDAASIGEAFEDFTEDYNRFMYIPD